MRTRIWRTIGGSCSARWRPPCRRRNRATSSPESPRICEGESMSESPWQKSSFSSDRDDCVELCRSSGRIAIREGDTPIVVIRAGAAQVRALLAAVKTQLDARPQL
ncbi:DUF397 domain-containing protein [Streptomyces sp. NPDC002536]